MGQRTVGVFQFTPDALPGYALFAPSRSPITYLIDNCGEQQFYWQSAYNPGNSVELLENVKQKSPEYKFRASSKVVKLLPYFSTIILTVLAVPFNTTCAK